MTSSASPTYDHKASKIVIFNRDNFADWERTYKAALIILEGWDFITSVEDLN
jgi:putative cell wall-binding protein